MNIWQALEQRIADRVKLSRRAVAVAFLDREPPGVQKFAGVMPAGCSFWRLAADGAAFYTVPADHFNCPVGSHTHRIALPPEREPEMQQTLGLMFDVGYIQPADLPQIPQLADSPRAIVYAPLGQTPVAPDVVILAGSPSAIMLLNEAALRAGAGSTPALGRPTCMALPAAIASGAAMSLGCIGNRIYTSLPDDELYLAVKGSVLEKFADALEVIASANQHLAAYAAGRRQSLATA
jgi:uncharacterized protein (DUF169 family)